MRKYKEIKLPNALIPVSLYQPTEDIKSIFIRLGVFEGTYSDNLHFSQSNFVEGFRNNFFFYDIVKSLLLFSNAVKFLKGITERNRVKFVFVGAPEGEKDVIRRHFRRIKFNYVFFPNDNWYPGYISKSAENKNTVLIVYNINSNYTACKEAFKSNIPVLGFATPTCDIRGIDYPILLNFQKSPNCYIKVLFSLFKIFNESKRF